MPTCPSLSQPALPATRKARISRRAFLALTAATTANAALGPAASCSRSTPGTRSSAIGAPFAFAAQPTSAHATLEQVLGATRCVVDELKAHESDSYYLGTSFGNTGPNGAGGAIGTWDCWYPNGKPKSNGLSYMNCAGFVVAVLEACGANCDQIGTYVGSSGYNRGNKSNLSRWIMYLADHASLCTRYESKDELLASGALRKGDLIIADPRDWSAPDADCHVLFFWGDSPSHDVAWHSSNHAEGVMAGTCPGNMISKISAKASNVYWLHVPLTSVVKLVLEKRSAAIAIADGSEGAPFYSLEGATFSVFERCENGNFEGLVAQFTTDAAGRAEIELPPNSDVWIREDAAPKGFCSWTAPQRVHVGNAQTCETLFDEPQTVRITVEKVDAETQGSPQGHATLEGAIFEAIDSKGRAYTAKTSKANDESYVASFPEMPRGRIRIREAAPPRGYAAAPLPGAGDDGWLSIDAAPDGNIRCGAVKFESRDRVVRGDIEGVKLFEPETDDDEFVRPALQGARFAFWLHDDGTLAEKGYAVEAIPGAAKPNGEALFGTLIGIVESDVDGRFTSKDLIASWKPEEHGGMPKPECALPFGTYTLIETSCPDPALRLAKPISNIEVHSAGCIVFLPIEDKRIASPVRVRKIDANTKGTVLAPGTCIELLKRDDTGAYKLVEFSLRTPQSETISQFSIPESGVVQFPQKLVWGSYAIREISTIAPYLVRSEPVYFEVGKNHDWDEDDVIVVDLPNEQATGTIEGLKRDAETGGGVAGATYEARAAHDIVSPDGSCALAQGQVAGVAESDEAGRWSIAGLPLGNGVAEYVIVETRSPDRYVAEHEEHRVTLTWENDQTSVVFSRIDIEEAPTKVHIRKIDRQSHEPIPGVEFTLQARWPETKTIAPSQDGADNSACVDDSEESHRGANDDAMVPEPITLATDERGEADASHLARGFVYALEETGVRSDLGYVSNDTAPERYLAEDGRWYESEAAYREASQNGTLGEDMWDIEIENDFTRLKFFKVDAEAYRCAKQADAETGAAERAAQVAHLQGGLFRLEDASGHAIAPVDTRLNADGWEAQGATPVEFDHMRIGETYRFIEICAPEGYTAEEQYLEVSMGNSTEAVLAVMANKKNEALAKTNDWAPRGIASAAGMAIAGGAAALAAYTKRRREAENWRDAG